MATYYKATLERILRGSIWEYDDTVETKEARLNNIRDEAMDALEIKPEELNEWLKS